MKTPLYNVAHPLAESGKPIFIPFGEWNYDGQSRQRLDRAHGEKIANELNARVAKGEPGIPVYQGHPDVPALASKYPDKGALGWITRIELVNESPDGRAVPGLALTVEWDRDPGRGFRWFSPYWLANSRDGGTYIVDEIASIGLVNNPNIPEFRLANEEQPTKKKLNPAIIELAAKYDRLANEANFDESKHPRADDGKFSSGGGGGGSGSKESGSEKSSDSQPEAKTRLRKMVKSKAVSVEAGGRPTKDDVVFEYQHKMYFVGKDKESVVQEFVDRGLVKRVRGYHTMFEGDDGRGLSRNAFILKERGAMNSLAKELAAKYDRLANEKALANVIDANGMGHDDDNGQFDGSGTGGSSGGSSGGSGGESQSSRLDRMLGEARAGVDKAKAKATAAKKSRISASRKFHKELEAHLKKLRERRLALKEFNDKMAARLANSVDANGMEHVEAGVPEGGQFAGHSEATNPSAVKSAATKKENELKKWMGKGLAPNATIINRALQKQRELVSGNFAGMRKSGKEYATMRKKNQVGWADRQSTAYRDKQAFMVRNRELAAIHKAAILAGLKYNPRTRQYE